MKKLIAVTVMLVIGGLTSGCTDPKTYPVTGEACGPGDPVKTVNPGAADCVPKM